MKNNKTPSTNNENDNSDTILEGLTFEIVEQEERDGTKVTRKGVYLLPNLVTTLSLLSGFVSILLSTQGKFKLAITCIFLSALLDGLDGRLARMLNAQSAFGEQFDSLTDMLAFGVAPAMLVFHWSMQPLGRVGIACAFLFTACAAFRLARFNVQIGSVDKKYFVGLASPLAGIMLASLVMVGVDRPNTLDVTNPAIQYFSAFWVVIVGLLMVSNSRYYSFKEFDSKRVPFIVMPMVVLLIGLVIYDIPVGMLTLSVVYALSGIWTTFFKKII